MCKEVASLGNEVCGMLDEVRRREGGGVMESGAGRGGCGEEGSVMSSVEGDV